MYDTAQVPEKMDSLSLSKKDFKRASKNCSHCIRVLRIGYLPLIADVFTIVVRPYCTVNTIDANATINFMVTV